MRWLVPMRNWMDVARSQMRGDMMNSISMRVWPWELRIRMIVEGVPGSWSEDVEWRAWKVREAAVSEIMADCGVAGVCGGNGTV